MVNPVSCRRLTLLFDSCVVEIDGFNLKQIESDIRENKLNVLSEMPSVQVTLKRSEGIEELLISNIRCAPYLQVAIAQNKRRRR